MGENRGRRGQNNKNKNLLEFNTSPVLKEVIESNEKWLDVLQKCKGDVNGSDLDTNADDLGKLIENYENLLAKALKPNEWSQYENKMEKLRGEELSEIYANEGTPTKLREMYPKKQRSESEDGLTPIPIPSLYVSIDDSD